MKDVFLTVLGGVIAGGIGLWLEWWRRSRVGKDGFLAFIGHQEASLDLSRDDLRKYYRDSLVPLNDAIFAIKPFVSEVKFLTLRKLWRKYKERGESEKDWQWPMDDRVAAHVFGLPASTDKVFANEWLAEMLQEFREAI